MLRCPDFSSLTPQTRVDGRTEDVPGEVHQRVGQFRVDLHRRHAMDYAKEAMSRHRLFERFTLLFPAYTLSHILETFMYPTTKPGER